MHRLSLLLGTAAALVPHRTNQRLQPLKNDVIDVSESAVVERLENAPFIDGTALVAPEALPEAAGRICHVAGGGNPPPADAEATG